MKQVIKRLLSLFNIGVYKITTAKAEKKRIEQIAIEDEKRKNKWLTDTNFKTIVDVGANAGQFAQKMRNLFENVMIYSFEPIPEAYQALTNNFKNDHKFKAFNVGLAEEEFDTTFHLNEFSPSSSLLDMDHLHKLNFPFTENTKEITVNLKTLDNVLSNYNLKSPLLVKLDVQGYEDKVIKGGYATISKADLLIIEVSFAQLYKNQPLFDDIYCQLKLLGFKYIGNFDQLISPADGTILQADAIFKR